MEYSIRVLPDRRSELKQAGIGKAESSILRSPIGKIEIFIGSRRSTADCAHSGLQNALAPLLRTDLSSGQNKNGVDEDAIFTDILRFGPSSFTSSQIALWTPTATTPQPTSPHYTQLFLAFWLGGFFCSIILPRLAFFAWGAWQTLRRSMSLGRDHNILRDGLGKRRRSKRRRPIDFTTVPRRGLVVFQYIAERLVGLAFQTQLRRAFEHSIASVNNPNIRRIEMHTFQTMSAPRLHSGRMYDMGKKAMAFDVDATWNDAFESTVTITTKRLGVKVPVRIHNVKFVGPIRVILTPLIESPPGFGANIFR